MPSAGTRWVLSRSVLVMVKVYRVFRVPSSVPFIVGVVGAWLGGRMVQDACVVFVRFPSSVTVRVTW